MIYKVENGNFPEQGNDTLAPAHALADTYQNRKRSFTKTRNTKTTIEADRLKESVLAPDKWGDYPHHYGKSHAIAKLWTSRFGYLNRQYKKLKWKMKRK